MKILSITLTGLLLIPILACSIAAFQNYYQLDSDLIPKSAVYSIMKPFIFYSVSYFIFFILSIFLNIKGKFTINIVLSACLILIYLVSLNCGTWLK